MVSVLVELCDVGGKRLSGWGQPCGMLLLREVGWGERHRLGRKTKRAQGFGAFFFFFFKCRSVGEPVGGKVGEAEHMFSWFLVQCVQQYLDKSLDSRFKVLK